MDNNYKRDELRRFTTVFTEEAIDFLNRQESKAREKILSNIRKAEVIIDNELFKKINEDVWEFRTLYKRKIQNSPNHILKRSCISDTNT